MPNITIEGPVLIDMNAKRVMVKEITDAVEKAYKIPREHVVVTIYGIPPENVATGGVLIADHREK